MMSDVVVIHNLADVDRGGKVRWLALELGLPVRDVKIRFGEHRAEPYTQLHPFGQVPTVEFRGRVLIESNAIMQYLAEQVPEPNKLFVSVEEADRFEYLYWISLFADNFEGRLAEVRQSQVGILPEVYYEVHEKKLRRILAVMADTLPARGWLCGERFTVADIVAGYSLRLAITTGLIERQALEPYFSRLVARPAAVESRMFNSLTDG